MKTIDEWTKEASAHAELQHRVQLGAERVRDALARVPGDHWRGNFRRFPLGCDRPSALVLGLWLERKGIGPVIIASERRRGRWSTAHSWVEIGDLIADITGDLFSTDAVPRPAVLVISDRRWHAGFRGAERYTVAEILEQRVAHRRPVRALFVEVVKQLEREA